MIEEKTNIDISERIMNAVQSGIIKMRPKWHFILQAVLAVTGLVVLALLALYLASFIIFALQRSGVWFIPAFGLRGIFVFLFSLPWLLILLVGFFLIVLEILVRRYSFAYRWPLLYSALAVVLIVLIGGFAVAKTPVHRRLVEYDKANGRFCCAGMYRNMDRHQFDEIHVGKITEFSDRGFNIQNRNRDSLAVLVTPRTRLPYGFDYGVGDVVVIFGLRRGDSIDAFGIRRIDETDPFIMQFPGPFFRQ